MNIAKAALKLPKVSGQNDFATMNRFRSDSRGKVDGFRLSAYTRADVNQLHFIRRARDLGFSVAEISD